MFGNQFHAKGGVGVHVRFLCERVCATSLSMLFFLFFCNIRAAKRVIVCWRNLGPQSLKRSYKWQYLMHNSFFNASDFKSSPGQYLFYLFSPLFFKAAEIYIFLINEGTLQNMPFFQHNFLKTPKNIYIYQAIKDKSRWWFPPPHTQSIIRR